MDSTPVAVSEEQLSRPGLSAWKDPVVAPHMVWVTAES